MVINPMKIAIVHYWWFRTRGGEKVLMEILKKYPNSDLYLLCGSKRLINSELKKINFQGSVNYSALNKIPFISKIYKNLFFIMPFFLELFNFNNYKLIISSESGPAKNIITPVGSTHICYCHSPMRYLWDMKDIYLNNTNILKKFFANIIFYSARKADLLSSFRVDFFIANSSFIKKRIWKFYKRKSEVIFPPVDVNNFKLSNKKNFYLYFGELINYKNPKLAIDVFNKLGHELIVIGDGPLFSELKKISNENIKFLGRLDDYQIAQYLSQAKCLVYPGIEDFGIIPVEAMASGTPVIAANKGGALDTIMHSKTGLLVENNVQSFIAAIENVEKGSVSFFTSKEIQEYAKKFSQEKFLINLEKFINKCLKKI